MTIWVGNTDGTPMWAIQSVLSAGAIWHAYLPAACDSLQLPARDFAVPPGLAFGKVCGKNDWFIVGMPPRCSVEG